MTADVLAALGRVHSYSLCVGDYEPVTYVARTASKARYRAWLDYSEHRQCSFRRFLEITRTLHISNAPGIGEPILVCGEPALRVGMVGEATRYILACSDTVMRAHPMEVAAFRSQAGRDE